MVLARPGGRHISFLTKPGCCSRKRLHTTTSTASQSLCSEVTTSKVRNSTTTARGYLPGEPPVRAPSRQLPCAQARQRRRMATTNGDSLSFKNISMTFPDGTAALRDVSFSVAKGEFVTIGGPSGCGKSTLLKIASGLLRQGAGTAGRRSDHAGGFDRVREPLSQVPLRRDEDEGIPGSDSHT